MFAGFSLTPYLESFTPIFELGTPVFQRISSNLHSGTPTFSKICLWDSCFQNPYENPDVCIIKNTSCTYKIYFILSFWALLHYVCINRPVNMSAYWHESS